MHNTTYMYFTCGEIRKMSAFLVEKKPTVPYLPRAISHSKEYLRYDVFPLMEPMENFYVNLYVWANFVLL